MIKFLLTVWGLAKPYKFRLVLGVICGVLSGFAEPLLLVTIYLVFRLIFGDAMAGNMTDRLKDFSAVPHDQSAIQQWFGHIQMGVQQWFENAQLWLRGNFGDRAWFKIFVVSLIPLTLAVRGIVGYLNIYLMNWVTVRALNDLRVRAFDHLLNLPLSFFSRNSTGELMSRISDINVLQNIIGVSISIIVKEPVSLITFAVGLIALAPGLTFFSLLIFPICVVPIAVYSRKVRKSSAAIQTYFAGVARMMHESFSGNRIIKAYNLEQTVVGQFRDEIRKFIGHYMRVVRSQEIPGPLIEFFGSIGVALLLLYYAFRPDATPTKFGMFVITIFMMYKPLKNLIRLHTQIEQARAATERIFQLLATPSTILESPNPKPLQARCADIHFDGIDFDYEGKPVLKNIDLTVKSGQMVALVGASGSGKTTLTNLLLRFYDPVKGVVRIGGTDIREVAIRDLRNQIAIVTQETILFNDSIRNNIAMGRPGASEEEIVTAAKNAFAHDFIMEKPEGYNTVIGDRGAALSGGQRQRLAIARAILRDVPILVLDEATSALDTESERAVQAALEELMKGRTTICIAHRLSTIQKADLIVVLHEGQVVETGTHAELLRLGGVYHKLHSLQFRSEPPAAAGTVAAA